MDYVKTLLILFICFMGCSGCAKHIYIPVEKESVSYRFKTLRDSIYFRDSIYMEVKGDTVLKESFRYIYVDRFIKDTIHIKDSINVPIPYEVVKYKSESFKSKFISIFASIIAGMILMIILQRRFFR